jgi:hypothetical protein
MRNSYVGKVPHLQTGWTILNNNRLLTTMRTPSSIDALKAIGNYCMALSDRLRLTRRPSLTQKKEDSIRVTLTAAASPNQPQIGMQIPVKSSRKNMRSSARSNHGRQTASKHVRSSSTPLR